MKEFPKKMMTNILWNFSDDEYNSQSNFITSLLAYNEKIFGEDFELEKDKKILDCPKVVIQYIYWDEKKEDDIEFDFLLIADDGVSFNQTELLFKVHNKVCEKLIEADNSYFEGFLLWEGENPNNPNIPLYFLLQGS